MLNLQEVTIGVGSGLFFVFDRQNPVHGQFVAESVSGQAEIPVALRNLICLTPVLFDLNNICFGVICAHIVISDGAN